MDIHDWLIVSGVVLALGSFFLPGGSPVTLSQSKDSSTTESQLDNESRLSRWSRRIASMDVTPNFAPSGISQLFRFTGIVSVVIGLTKYIR